ncbi:hypothetical protein CDV36_010486 [Fusarium kuroshium]|uniref:Uncharacterized protein n=1 Tax=Fusarium kuroshium TaxID=2010991 RepID=A0A3M2RX55_9HYPO|nr:hypothetical protein CDV36_010486 [Fusarium kuroshium]
MDKVVERMAKYDTGAALKNAKASDGTPIIRPGQISDEEANKAAEMFAHISRANLDNKNREAKLQGLLTTSAENPDPFTGVEVYRWESDKNEKGVKLQSNLMDEDEDMALLAQFAHDESELSASGDINAMGWFDSPWDIFPWLVRKLKKAVEQWATELRRVVGKAWSFVLDTAKAIGKAAVWVFEKTKLVGKALYELVGLVLNFGFVKDWSNSIGAFVDAGLDVADDRIASSIRSVLPDFLKKVEDGTQEAAEKGPREHGVTEERSESKDTGSSSISQSWAMDQFQHGGGLKVLQDDGSSNMGGISPVLTQGVEEIKAIILELGDPGKTLGSGVWDLIQGKCSFESFMKRVDSDISKFVLKALREIASKIIDKISHVTRSLKNLLNRKLFLPIFSFLWRKLTGKDLTILTLVSLLLGWAAAAFHKAVLGDRAIAPQWEGHLNKDNFKDLINNKAVSIINGGVAAVNVLINLPLGPDRTGVPGIPRNYISYLSGSTTVIDMLMKVFKWKFPDSAAMCRRISTTWSVAVGLVIFGNEVFVEGWLITRHGRIDRLWVGIQNEILKLLDAGASSVSAWTIDNNLEAALVAEVAKLPYTYARTALQLELIGY